MAEVVLAAPASERPSWRPVWLEVALVAALVMIAAAVRLSEVHVVPPYTDETEEALRAWRIATGELRPLTNVDSYVGALWSYVVAGAFRVFGRDPAIPRLASLAAGALTVGATYLLGRQLYGRTAGAAGAVLLAGNAAHVLVNSHVAWSSCATPLFTTTAFWLLARALDRPARPLWLGLAGLAFGLALQTHPSVAVFVLGAAGYALWRDPRLPLRPGAWLAGALFLLGYANVLVYNLGSEFDTLAQARRVSVEYAGGAGLDAWGYVASLLGILVLVVQVTAGVVEPRLTAAEHLADLRMALALLASVAALAWSVQRRAWLLLFVAVPVVLLMPALNQRWSPILAARYVMPLLPLLLVALGGMAVALTGRRARGEWAAAVGAVGAAAVVAVVQQAGLGAYYRDEIAAGRSNDGPWRMVRLVEAQRRAREPVVVHADLHLLPTGGGGTWAKALDYLLELKGLRKDVSPRDPGARLRACEVTAVALRYVGRDARRPVRDEAPYVELADRRPADEPRHLAYWIARPAGPPGERRAEPGGGRLDVPYALPWRNRSLFDPRVATFDTGCE